MRVIVDETICQGHGRCAFIAPTVFSLDEDLVLTYDGAPGEGLREAIEEAVAACPTQAIRMESDEAPAA
jgi:ferredoxin